MNKVSLTGLVAAVHTPFKPDGSINLDTIEKQADHLVANDINVAFVCGSTGESHSLTVVERLQLAQRWLEVAAGTQLKVVVHVGSNCLPDARELAAHAQKHGALAIAALAPCYFKPRTMPELIDWCAALAAAAPETPFYFYDIPVLTGVKFSMKAFLEQAAERIPSLNGIKYTNSDMMDYAGCLNVNEGSFDIPWGIDESLLSALATGAKGAVGSSYNFAAPIYQELINAFRLGDLTSARTHQNRSVRLIETLASYGYMGAAKAVMKILGVDVGPARLPHANPAPEQQRKLARELEQLGFFEWIGHSRSSACTATT